MLLSAGVLLISIPTIIFGIESLTCKHCNDTLRFLNDFLNVHFNLGSFLVSTILILIIYPRYYMIGLFGSKALSEKTLNRISRVTIGNERNSTVTLNDGSYKEYKKRTNSYAYSPMDSLRNSGVNWGNSRMNSSRNSDASVGKSIARILMEQQKQIELFQRKFIQKSPHTTNLNNDSNINNPLSSTASITTGDYIKEEGSHDQIL